MGSSPALPPLPAPKLPGRVAELLRSPTTDTGDDSQFETASWGSPYPRSHRNLRRQSFSSEPSDDSPVHHLSLETPFLRPLQDDESAQDEHQSEISAAAAVLANRVRRQTQTRGLTEDWIRTHTTGVVNAEPRHWFSDGSDSEHSSLSGSQLAWFDDRDLRTPKAAALPKSTSQSKPYHPRARSSLETLKPESVLADKKSCNMDVGIEALTREFTPESDEGARGPPAVERKGSVSTQPHHNNEMSSPDKRSTEPQAQAPVTPTKKSEKPLPKDPAMTPRIRKKVPWKGKNIMVMVPRDDERGIPGNTPRPLRTDEIERMFASWEELGYSVDGFDLLVEGYQPPGTDESQSRQDWPTAEQIANERGARKYNVVLPDLNAWKNYVEELQEAKLRALGVSFAEDEPPEPSISPPTSNPSRQPSAQYPALPFSPPIPTSSASSSHGLNGLPFQGQFIPNAQSPGIPQGTSPVPFGVVPGKYNPRQSISVPPATSPFQLAQSPSWPNAAGILQGMSGADSPSLGSLNGMLSPQLHYGVENLQQANHAAFNPHQRHQSMQYFPPQAASGLTSPRLHDVQEADEENLSKSPSKTPEPSSRHKQSDSLQAEIADAEYHLEEQLRNQLEHEDYNPKSQTGNQQHNGKPLAAAHNRDDSDGAAIAERFASEQGQPLELHHPRPHSRGHSLTQNFYHGHVTSANVSMADQTGANTFTPLKGLPEASTDLKDSDEEIQTNPSDLGTPKQNPDFSASFGQHQRNASTASNPWQEPGSAQGSTRKSSHSSKPSLSGLNAKAPEFKLNPTSNFTPGVFNFSADNNNFQPTALNARPPLNFNEPAPPSAIPKSSSFTKMHASAPSFAPGSSIFSFSSDGPKFRPDAPSFTPFQSLSNSVSSETGPPSGHTQGQKSIFGNINITEGDIVKPARKSKAIPIVRPSSRASAVSFNLETEEEDPQDGRVTDSSRVKRARSAAPDGDMVPAFADRPGDDLIGTSPKPEVDEDASGIEDVSLEEENIMPADTSLSSIHTTDQADTMATTAAPSVASPNADEETVHDLSSIGLIDSKFEVPDFSVGPRFGEKRREPEKRKSLSAAALPFVPSGSLSITGQDASGGDSEQDTPAAHDAPAAAAASTTPADNDTPPARVKLTPKPKGLAASRFAKPQAPATEAESPSLIPSIENEVVPPLNAQREPSISKGEPLIDTGAAGGDREITFEEIDAIMEDLENNPDMGVNKTMESSHWKSSSAAEATPVVERKDSVNDLISEGMSPTPRLEASLLDGPANRVSQLNDPFVDKHQVSSWSPELAIGSDRHQAARMPYSDWEATFTEDEHDKLESRAQFFDGRVNDVVGSLLASRLEPMERALASIQNALATEGLRKKSSRRELRSLSGEVRESDADDEDEEPAQRSLSPRRDRRLDQMRAVVAEAFASHQRSETAEAAESNEATPSQHQSIILEALDNMKEQFEASLKANAEAFANADKKLKEDSDSRELDDLHNSASDEQAQGKIEELQAMMMDLANRLAKEQGKTEHEISERRAAEDAAAELNRKLQAAETRVEVEIINRSVFDQRVADLEDRLRQQETKTEEEVSSRRTAEDRLSEVQRLLRIASEEESRLRDVVEEKEDKIRSIETASGKSVMRMKLLEAAQANATQSQSEMTNKFNAVEADLKAVRQDNNHWRSEAEKSDEIARRNAGELAHIMEENKHLQKSLNTLTTQLEENERLRESWRGKFLSLQEDMSKAARDVTEDNARRIKKDQALRARQEVLDARLQAEAKTRERLEIEMERLQENERTGIRAVSECKRLEALLTELRDENHKLQQETSRARLEFEEARESGASEVKRTRMTLQTEIDSANNQVNVVREELEEQSAKLRAELDSVKLEADTAKAQNEMLLEEAQANGKAELDKKRAAHTDELEDLHAKHERQLNDATEEASRNEQQLLERLGLSSSKIEHLQDRILHLEDKLEIAKQAAAAAAQAAKAAGVDPGATANVVAQSKRAELKKLDLPEKISPQALRESIMVLQEQLQAREQRIEELEQTLSKTDPEAESKISKRDDEITWLRELLAVRHGDLQDVIAALSGENIDQVAVKDAAIRLKANLQMEQQERERAMNGGSAISLPNIAQGIQAATPRVAGPIAAAWDTWRKSGQPALRSIGTALASPAPRHTVTPSRSRHHGRPRASVTGSQMGGLMTPPASGLRQTPKADDEPQPTAFANTGRRFPSGSSSDPRERRESHSSQRSQRQGKMTAVPGTQPELDEEPMTPPMMRRSGYDSDAQAGDFDDHDFFDED